MVEPHNKPKFMRDDFDEQIAKARAVRKKEMYERNAVLTKATKLVKFRIKELSDKQRHCISLLADFTNNWPVRFICNQVGICYQTFKNWRNDPFFVLELDKEITRRKTMFRLEAYKHFFKRIKAGDRRTIRDYFRMTGDLKQQIEITEKVEAKTESELDQEIERLSSELGITITDES